MHGRVKKTALSKGEIYTQLCMEAEIGYYTAYLRGKRCKTEDFFFNEVSAAFQFPYYFGENWAAMDECLCDLEWLYASKIFVVVDDFSCMFSNQAHIQDILKKRVVKYFAIMIDYWETEGVPVEVWLNN
jgi:hypothetical protein